MKPSTVALPALLACALWAVSADALAGERRLDAEAIRDVVAGSAVTIVAPERQISGLRLETGGAIRGATADPNEAGRWSIRGNALCLEIGNVPDPGCMAVIRRDEAKDRLFLFTPAGEPFGEMVVGPTRS